MGNCTLAGYLGKQIRAKRERHLKLINVKKTAVYTNVNGDM